MKSHTGGAMTLGKGMIYAMSTCQKINTRSSTEGELVGVNDVMPQHRDMILWSTMLLEKNGRSSSSKWTCHINIWYFVVTNRIASKEVSVTYCPTGNMIC